MIVGDLFSGIGGFSLAAEWMGWSTAWFSEIDPFASRVLKHHWPNVPNHGDITRIDWTTVEPIDLLTGGFPCQPHSLAGKRAGSNDERDLFSEIIRAAGVLRPRFIVLENVPGLFTSDDGRFFGRVLGSLAALGYDAEWRVLSAAEVGAPHRRERVWITAYANGQQHQGAPHAERRARGAELFTDANGDDGRARRVRGSDSSGARQPVALGAFQVVPDAMRQGRQGRQGRQLSSGARPQYADARWWAVEPDVGRVGHGVPARVDRLRCLGNSIVPQCAREIFRAIEAREGRVAA